MSDTNFTLDPRIENDSVLIGDLPLSHVRLHKNAAFPWLMLMPRRDGASEIIDLSIPDQEALLHEIRFASLLMKKLFSPTKLNVANLGNVTPQLHVHVIARFDSDQAWPGPVWNSGVSKDYEPGMLSALISELQQELASFQ